MKRYLLALLTTIPRFSSAVLILPAAFVPCLQAALVESFDYDDGYLGAVSGGKWERWDPGVDYDGDAMVANGAAVLVQGTDVIRTFPAVLTALGQTAVFSFNLRMASAAESCELWLVPATGSFYSSNTNYGSGLGLNFGRVAAPANMASLEISEGSGISSGNININNNPPVTRGEPHAIRIEMLRGAANISYSLYIDDNLLRSSTFVLNDSRGANAMEFTGTGAPAPDGVATGTVIDDISVLPGNDSPVPLQSYEILHQWTAGTGWQGRNGLAAGPDGALYGSSGGGPGGLGMIYRLTEAGAMMTLASFSGNGATNKGGDPAGRLLFDGGKFYGTTQKGGVNNRGTVFTITPAGILTTLVQFSGNGAVSKGATPRAGLVRGSDGNYYGTTSEGGASNFGTIFKMTPAGTLTTLVEFTGNGVGNKGLNPQSGLAQGTDSNFYGTTAGGGAWGFGTVFQMAPGGSLTTLADFSGPGNTGAIPLGGLTAGSDGNFHGTASGGGATGGGTVFRITSGGTLTTLAEFPGGAGISGGSNPQTGLTPGVDGNFYGTTAAGGTYNHGTLFRMTTGGAVTTLVNFSGINGTAPGGSPQFGPLLFGPGGHLYGTTQSGGAGNGGVVFRLHFGPAATTRHATQVTPDGATVNGTVNPNGHVTAVSFEYGTDPALAGATTVRAGSTSAGSSSEPVSAVLSGLKSGTTYHFRVRGVNQQNLTPQSGAILSFTTASVQRVHELIAAFGAPLSHPGFASLTPGQDGFFWGTAAGGIYKVKADGTEWRTVVRPGNKYLSGSLVSDGAGFMWGVSKGDAYTWGSGDHHGHVYKLDVQSGEMSTVVQFTGAEGSVPGANPFAGLVRDSAGFLWGTTRMGGSGDYGTVFRINPGNGAVTSIAQFTGRTGSTKGAHPIGSMVNNGAGALVGTTTNGGAFDAGTVFKVDAATGILTTLVEFTDSGATNRGAYPVSALVADGSGFLWGTTSRGGGPAGYGTVFRISPDGDLTTVVDFEGNNATNKGAFPFGGLIIDGAGTLWGTTAGFPLVRIYFNDIQFGDQVNDGTLFKIDPVTGELTTVIEFSPANRGGTHPLGGLIRDDTGALMGTTDQGGTSNMGTVYRVDPGSGTLTTLVEFAQNPASHKGFTPTGGLAIDDAGNLWGTTVYGGSDNAGTIFKVHPMTGEWGTPVEFTRNGPANKGAEPEAGLVSDGSGSFWGTTVKGGTIDAGTVFKFNPGSGVFETLVEFTYSNPPNKGGGPYAPLVSDGNGSFWGTTYYGGAGAGTIFKVNAGTGTLTTVTEFGTGNNRGSSPRGGLTRDSAGFFWGTTNSGGALESGTVFKINAITGALATVVEFTGDGSSRRGALPAGSLTWSDDGFFRGTTTEGGTRDIGTVFKIRAATGALTTLHEFDYPQGAYPFAGLTRGQDGSFYGTASDGGAGFAGTVFKITSQGVLTTLFDFTGDGPQAGTGAWPYGTLLVGPDGHLYGTTGGGGPGGGGTVFRLRLGPSPVTLPASLVTLAGATLNGTLNPNGLASDVTFEYGTDAALAGSTMVPAGTTTAGEIPEPVSARLTGLLPNTTYYFRVRGLNPENSHVQTGAILSFSTSESAGYRSWAADSGVVGADAAPDADPDGDGLKNAVEYVFGTRPAVPDSSPVSAAVVDDTHFVYRFSRTDASETPDTTLTVEAGTVLMIWPASYTIGTDTALSSPGVTVIENGTAPDTVLVMIPRNSGPAKFARLKVTVIP